MQSMYLQPGGPSHSPQGPDCDIPEPKVVGIRRRGTKKKSRAKASKKSAKKSGKKKSSRRTSKRKK